MFGLAYLLLAVTLGLILSRRLPGHLEPEARIGTGLAFGLAIAVWLPFPTTALFGSKIGIHLGAQLSLALLAAITSIHLLRLKEELPQFRESLARGVRSILDDDGRKLEALFIVGWACLLTYLYEQHTLRHVGKDGWYVTGYSFFDQAMHMTFASTFLHSQNGFPPDHPLFAGLKLTYPILPDLLAAHLASLGGAGEKVAIEPGTIHHVWFDLPAAMWTSASIAGIATTLLIAGLARRIAHDRSPLSTIGSVSLFFLSGGIGAIFFLDEIRHGTPWKDALGLYDYAKEHDKFNLHFGNTLTSLLLPSRCSPFGWAMALAAITLVLEALDDTYTIDATKKATRRTPLLEPLVAQALDAAKTEDQEHLAQRKRLLLYAALLGGALPFVYPHAFLFGVFVVGCYALALRNVPWKAWILPGVVLAALALPQVAFFSHYSFPRAFALVHLGWVGDKTFGEWLWFWVRNAGPATLLLPIAWLVATPRQKVLTLPMIAFLVFGNVFQLQPWEEDNMKILCFGQLGAALVIGPWLTRVWHSSAAGKVLAAELLLACTVSGSLSVARETFFQNELIDDDAYAFAELVLVNTQPKDVILCASEHTCAIPMLTGRRVVMGHTFWLFAHGIDLGLREERTIEVHTMFRADEPEKALALLKKYNVDWVAIGEPERKEFHEDPINEEFFEKLCGPPFKNHNSQYALYKVPKEP